MFENLSDLLNFILPANDELYCIINKLENNIPLSFVDYILIERLRLINRIIGVINEKEYKR